jgi:hypothetical protein
MIWLSGWKYVFKKLALLTWPALIQPTIRLNAQHASNRLAPLRSNAWRIFRMNRLLEALKTSRRIQLGS